MSHFFLVDASCYRRRDEVSLVRHFFLSNDWHESARLEDADATVFFSCAGLRFLVDEKIKEIDGLRSRLKPGAELLVGSCLPGIDGERLSRVFAGKTISPTDFSALNSLPGITVRIDAMPGIWGRDAAWGPIDRPTGAAAWRIRLDDAFFCGRRLLARYSPLPVSRPEALLPKRRSALTFSVAAGCSRKCAYCAKPFASGTIRSKSIDAVVDHLVDGIRAGYRRFDLFADSIGVYGIDQGVTFGDLLDRFEQLRERFSIGLFDLHPQDFLRFFDRLERLARSGRIHYLHVPVQSGSERILKLMHRSCRVDTLVTKLAAIRQQGPFFMQSGIIAGFPTETDDEFEATLQLLQRVAFDNVYVHYYCDMPNTPASMMDGKIGPDVMRRRLERVKAAGIRHNLAATLHEWNSNLAFDESSIPPTSGPMPKTIPLQVRPSA